MSDDEPCTCLNHSPQHAATYMVQGTAQAGLAAGTHCWEPWFDGSCGYVARDMMAEPDDAGANYTTTCEGAVSLTGEVSSFIGGGGCNYVAGPTGTMIITGMDLALTPGVNGGTDFVESEDFWDVDHISTPWLQVVFTPDNWFEPITATEWL